MNANQQTTTPSLRRPDPSETWALFQLIMGRTVPPDRAESLIQRKLAVRARLDVPCLLDGVLTSEVSLLTDEGAKVAQQWLQNAFRGPTGEGVSPVDSQLFAFSLMAESYRICGNIPPDQRPFVRIHKRLILVQHGIEVCYVCNPEITLAELRKLPDGAGLNAFWECL